MPHHHHHHHHHRLLLLRSTPLPQLSPGGAAASNTVTAAYGPSASAPAAPGHELPALLLFFALVLSFIFFVLGFLLRDIFRCFCHRSVLLVTKRGGGGIDPAVLSSFPVVPYCAVRTRCGPDCVVCLGEFETDDDDDEVRVRVLTVCGHMFHVECIDIWLESHATCPICRADVRGKPDGLIVNAVLEAQNDQNQAERRGTNEELHGNHLV